MVLLIPVLIGSKLLAPTNTTFLTSQAELGNLIQALNPLQIVGPWLASDFRVMPTGEQLSLTYLFTGVVLALAIIGIIVLVKRRATAPLLYVFGSLSSSLLIVLIGSPWVDGKAFASVAPALLLIAGCAVYFYAAHAKLPALALGSILAGVIVASNVFAYGSIDLAPSKQLQELEQISHLIKGSGPTLMTEYQPYGVRHLLRDSDAEGISELRRRPILLENGQEVSTGGTVDTDLIDWSALTTYRNLVLRTSPAQSRPPEAYKLVYSGKYYTVWQRPENSLQPPLRRVIAGDNVSPVGKIPCSTLKQLAATPGATTSSFSTGMPTTVSALGAWQAPESWFLSTGSGYLYPDSKGRATSTVTLPGGTHSLWLGGSLNNTITLYIDDQRAGESGQLLNNSGQWIPMGTAEISAGEHDVSLDYDGSDWRPGSHKEAVGIGPLVFAPEPHEPVQSLPTANTQQLCGQYLDWVEVR